MWRQCDTSASVVASTTLVSAMDVVVRLLLLDSFSLPNIGR
jgi:hypothetical protein